jgi:ABC-2 type transport system permease protein
MQRLRTAILMTAHHVMRNRIAGALALILPVLFFTLTVVTTSMRTVVFELASAVADPDIEMPARSGSLTFMAMVSIGFLSAFYGVNLMQNYAAGNRRLVFCGYKPAELALATITVLAATMVVLSAYCLLAMLPFFVPRHLGTVLLALCLIGFVYGCYGMLIGTLWKRELESIISVILLTNIDVGWLQNPIFYADIENKQIVHWLPAFLPVQVAMSGAFTDQIAWGPVFGSLAYGVGLLSLAILVFWLKVRKAK